MKGLVTELAQDVRKDLINKTSGGRYDRNEQDLDPEV